VYMGVPCNWGPAGIWDPHIHMEAPYEKHYSYNASGPDPDATGIWDAHIHRDVPRGDPQVYGTPIYTWRPLMRSIIPTMLLGPTLMPQVYGTPIYTGMFLGGTLRYMGLPYTHGGPI
jgi:hypothetical protein